jgi:thiamine biosynthesis lipoprotein
VPKNSRNNEIFARAALGLAFALAGCATVPDRALQRFEFRQPHMGVPFRIVLYATNETHAKIASDAAFARIAELNAKLSDYDLDSELSKLSRNSGQGHVTPVSDDLWRVLEASQQLAQRTDGAFDVTVGPVVNLWRHARRLQQFPRADRLTQARTRVGYKNLVLDPKTRSALLRVPEMRLDLGGIAKGFAADEALKTLRKHGIRRALVAAAGDIRLGDAPPNTAGWKVELDSGPNTNAPPQFVYLANSAIATSGDMFQFVELDGVRYSHIVDPRTGIGLTNSALVTVLAPDGMTADALATAVSVLDAAKGVALIKATPRTAVRILHKANGAVEKIEYPRERFSGGGKRADDRRAGPDDNRAAATR